ncbi:MAG: hypothetical protein GWO78_03750 [Dehalococcoidales bacterium]|nr:hypothetical protein [Dehalococcoidales bacterium]
MITDYQYRKSWSLFPTGVSVLATENNNQFFGMTANSIMSISLDPKIIMVSVGNKRTIIEYLKKDKEASVSILSKDQIDVADFFSNTDNKDNSKNYFEYKKNIFYVKNSLCHFFCKIIDSYIIGDHTVFSLNVLDMKLEDKEPLIWYKGNLNNKIL